MNRTTRSELDSLVLTINRLLGTPTTPYVATVGEHHQHVTFVAQIGNHHISGAYGGVTLHRMENEGGDVSTVFPIGYVPKRELADLMRAFVLGIEAGRQRDSALLRLFVLVGHMDGTALPSTVRDAWWAADATLKATA